MLALVLLCTPKFPLWHVGFHKLVIDLTTMARFDVHHKTSKDKKHYASNA